MAEAEEAEDDEDEERGGERQRSRRMEELTGILVAGAIYRPSEGFL